MGYFTLNYGGCRMKNSPTLRGGMNVHKHKGYNHFMWKITAKNYSLKTYFQMIKIK